jgi:hypothetical protein
MFDELRTRSGGRKRMTVEDTRRRLTDRAVSRVVPERRAEALVAAYIHELSSRHHAERELRRGEPAATRAS